MKIGYAIKIVAKQLLANAARDLEWEDTPDIGEHDWIRVVDECELLTPYPPRFNEAITLLEARAAKKYEEGT